MSNSRLLLTLFSSASLVGLAQAAHAAETAAAGAAATTGQVSEVVVTAAPREEVKARQVQHDAINVISVQSAETIAKYPDFNAAEALGRMPGVSISTDTGEGRFVNIRGIDGNLAGATFAGVPLLNTNPGGTYFGGGGRAVEYDTIPTGAIDGIIVTKTTLPDHEAEGLGGSVELTPRTAANISKPFLDGTLGWGYENERDVTGPFDAELAVGARFGFHNGLVVEGVNSAGASGAGWISNPTPFSFVLTASRMDDRRGFDDIEEDYNTNAAGTAPVSTYQDLQFRRYNYHRRRFSLGGEFDFQPNDNHHYYLRINDAGYVESVIKNRLTYNFSNPTPDASQPGYTDDTAALQLASTKEQETHRNTVYVLGGQDKFGDTVVDYRASYSRATFYVGYNYGSTWYGPTGAAVAYNNLGNNGDFPILKITNGVNPNDASLYTNVNPSNNKIKALSNAQEKDYDQEWAYAVNVLLPFRLLNDNDRFKVGVEARLRDKAQTEASESANPGTLNLENYSTAAVTDFYGRYTNGPQVNVDPLAALVTGPAGAYSLDFGAKENIYAGYAQYETRLGKWAFLAGARVEATDAAYKAYDDDADGGNGAVVSQPHNYTNVFPTVEVRYDFTPHMLVRAIYSTGIGRPGFNQVAAASTSNHDTTNPQITTGNPNLKPTTGQQFDLSFEWYLHHGGVIQLGLFDREFDNYIVTDMYRQLDTTPGSEFTGEFVNYTGFRNVSGAYARGMEAAYHQQFSWLVKPFDGLGIDANATVVDSKIQEYSAAASATGKAEDGLLPGTSRLTWNLAGFYEAHGIEARIAAEYVSKELFSLSGVGGSKALDTIQDNRLTVDWGSSYQLTSNWKLYFNVKNLTNAPLRFYMGSSSFPIQREFYEQTFEFGAKAHF